MKNEAYNSQFSAKVRVEEEEESYITRLQKKHKPLLNRYNKMKNHQQ